MQKGFTGREKGNGRALRYQDLEEGHNHTRRRRGMHDGGKTRFGTFQQATVPRSTALLFPNYGVLRYFFIEINTFID